MIFKTRERFESPTRAPSTKRGLVVNDKKIVNGAEDVIEAHLKRCQVAGTIVLEKGRGQEIVGKGNAGAQTKQMGVESSLQQVDVVELVGWAEVKILVGANFPRQIERPLGAVVEISYVYASTSAEPSAVEGAKAYAGRVPLVQVHRQLHTGD